jgi:hypothetical protein
MVDGKNATRSKAGAGAQEKTKMPKGGRKGGTIFPRLTLKQALEYSKKLVSKTAVAPQPEATIVAGVFNNAGAKGKVRLSALRQFGLLEGTAAAYKATSLAREIEAAADEAEKKPLLRRAMLTPKVYRELVNTYQGDQGSKGKFRGRVQTLGVHPDVSETCADLFMESAVTATLATVDGDGIRLIGVTDTPQAEMPETEEPDNGASGQQDEAAGGKDQKDQEEHADATPRQAGTQADTSKLPAPRPRMAADVTLNLTVDSSLDGEKLEKQLALLRRYGLI